MCPVYVLSPVPVLSIKAQTTMLLLLTYHNRCFRSLGSCLPWHVHSYLEGFPRPYITFYVLLRVLVCFLPTYTHSLSTFSMRFTYTHSPCRVKVTVRRGDAGEFTSEQTRKPTRNLTRECQEGNQERTRQCTYGRPQKEIRMELDNTQGN